MARETSVSRSIPAPPQTVWDLLTDAGSYADWNEAILSIEGPIALGNKVKLVSVVNSKRTFSLKVDVMEPPGRMVWSDGMPLGLFKAVRTYLLEEREGGTEFSMTEVFSGPLSGLMTKAIPDIRSTDSPTVGRRPPSPHSVCARHEESRGPADGSHRG